MSDLEDAIHDLTMEHLRCRDFGHNWRLQAHHARVVEWADSNVPVVERIVRCTECKAQRTEQIRRADGQMIRRLYAYPDGYRFPKGVAGQGGMAKAPFRREWVKRVIKEDA